MPTSKRPRKTHKSQPRSIPIVIRHDEDSERSLQLYAHSALLKFRSGLADEESWHIIVCRLNIGVTLANQNDMLDDAEMVYRGLDMMLEIQRRHTLMNKWGASDLELQVIGYALWATDELQKMMTRRQLRDAVNYVYENAAIH